MTATVPARRIVRLGPVGVLIRPRAVLASVGLLLVISAVLAFLVLNGRFAPSSPLEAWDVLRGHGSRLETLMVRDRRFGRGACAVLVGTALGAAGAITQGLTRNPIASPDLLGVSNGAALVAAFLISVAPALGLTTVAGLTGPTLINVGAFVGGTLAAAAVALLAWRGGFDGLRLILVGIAVNAVIVAAVSAVIVYATLEDAAVATRWLAGSLDSTRWSDARWLLVPILAGLLLIMVLSHAAGGLGMGPDVARLLGVRVGATSLLLVLIAVFLTALATAVAGPIAFIAFVAPHLARSLFRLPGSPVLASALTGAALLLIADTVADHLPVSLPVGVITPLIGGPYLLLILIRRSRRNHE